MSDPGNVTERESREFSPLKKLLEDGAIALGILALFTLGAFGAAIAVLGWKLALVGGFAGTCLMAFIGMPLILATMGDREADRAS